MASLATAEEVLLVLREKATEKSSKRRHRKASKMEKKKNTKDREEGSGAVCVYARLRFTLWEEGEHPEDAWPLVI